MISKTSYLFGLIAVGVLLGTAIVWKNAPPPTAMAPSTQVPIAAEVPRSPPSPPLIAAPVVASQVTAVAGKSLSADVKTLMSTGKPADGMRAWETLHRCAAAQRYLLGARQNSPDGASPDRAADLASGKIEASVGQVCGDLSSQALADRLPLLEKLAAAGVPSAALALAQEGPNGDPSIMYARWDDPLVVEWRNKIKSLIELGAAKGDPHSMFVLMEGYADGNGLTKPDATMAVQYAAAYYKTQELRQRPSVARPRQLLNELALRLPPDQAQQAIAAGEQLAINAYGSQQ